MTRVAVVGATGAVGSTILGILRERRFPATEVVPFASERSAGRTIDHGEADLEVRPLSPATIQGFDIALFSAGGSVSREWAPRFADAGCVVIDNSSTWRMEDHVPLVVAEVNPGALDGQQGIVANPNCSTMQMVMALKPIHDAAGIERIVVSTYQSTSGTGQRAVENPPERAPPPPEAKKTDPSFYPPKTASTVRPRAETLRDGAKNPPEKRKIRAETRKTPGEQPPRI